VELDSKKLGFFGKQFRNGAMTMLRIKVELVPFGDESNVKQIGEIVIANAGMNKDGTFKYESWISEDSVGGEPQKYIKIHSFDRARSFWHLIKLILMEHGALDEGHEPNQEQGSVCQRLLKKMGLKSR